jgi:hypothetical protein
MRGRIRIDQDFPLLAAGVNLARLVVFGVHMACTGCSV